MEAVVYTGLGEVAVQRLAQPEPGAGEALVRTRASGICHTDLNILNGRYGTAEFPLIPGHEYAGTVEAVGPGVTAVSVGDRVVVDPNLGCGKCRACRKGLSNLCADLGAYGVSTNGGFAEYSSVAVENLVPIGDLDFELAALAEPMGCVLNGIGVIGTDGIADALVVGAGPIGMLMGLALRSRGVTSVGVADMDEGRLELAESFGLAPFASGSEALAAREGTFDLVVDATGIPEVVADMTRYVGDGGRALWFGVCPPDARVEISPFEVLRRQLTIAGAHSLNHNIPDAVATIRAIGPDFGRLVTHKVPLAEIPDFLLGRGARKTLKVQAVP